MPRLSADLDVTLDLGSEGVETVVADLRASGFAFRASDPAAFARSRRVLPAVHSATEIPVDIILAGTDFEAAFLGRARRKEIDGVEVPIISPEDLIATKVFAGRPKDLEDVRGVIDRQGSALDLDLIRATLRALEQAVDRSDLVPAFEAELAAMRGDGP